MVIQGSHSDCLLLPIFRSCLVLEVNRSCYYEWLKPSEHITSENSEYPDLDNQIQEIALKFLIMATGGSLQNLRISAIWSTISAC
jgi:putative transposase